jgi:hypothetical protein
MNKTQKKIAFDVHGTLDNLTYTGFLLCIIDDLIDLGHEVIVWSTDKELARDFVVSNFLPDQKIRFMKKVKKNEESTPTVDIAVDDDNFTIKELNAQKVFLIQSLPKDKSLFIQKILE